MKNDHKIIVKWRWGSICVVNSALASWWTSSGGSGDKATEKFWLFPSGGQMISLK